MGPFCPFNELDLLLTRYNRRLGYLRFAQRHSAMRCLLAVPCFHYPDDLTIAKALQGLAEECRCHAVYHGCVGGT